MSPLGTSRGTVVSFDAGRGLGEIRDREGRTLAFHATQIADDSRAIEVGAEVAFELTAALGGRWEAAGIRPADAR